MGLRLKLTLFSVAFVFFASQALLLISILQTTKREMNDIHRYRQAETTRLKATLRERANSLCIGTMTAIEENTISPSTIEHIKKFWKPRPGWIWSIDTATNVPSSLWTTTALSVDSSIVNSLPDGFITQLCANVPINENNVADSFYCDVTLKTTEEKTDCMHMLWFARECGDGHSVITVGCPMSGVDSLVVARKILLKTESSRIIRDRIIFSVFLLLTCAAAIAFFSGILTRPIKSLVNLTEEISSGRKGFNERIKLFSDDELGHLAKSFNRLLDHIQSTLVSLQESGRKYRELVENANSSIIKIDSAGTILFFNEHAQRHFGYTVSEVLGRPLAEVIREFHWPNNSSDTGSQHPPVPPYEEREHEIKGGEVIWVGWTARPFYRDDGTLREILYVGSNITERKKAEALAEMQQRELIQSEKLVTLGTLVSGVAHEINNPNNFLILNSENLNSFWKDIAPVLEEHGRMNPGYTIAGMPFESLRQEIPSLLQGITDGARRIKRIVDSLKDYSRQDTGELNQKVDMKSVIDAATLIAGNLIKKSTHHFSILSDNDVPVVSGNFQQLEQVMLNLITNACQATDSPEKPITISISADRSTKSVIVSVTDKGVGISPSDMKHIFDPFFTTKREQGGTGLGLAISYSIIKNHHGKLKIRSTAKEGTIATIRLSAAE